MNSIPCELNDLNKAPLYPPRFADLCEPIPQEPLEEYLRLSLECAEKEVPKRLRELERRGQPPFNQVGFNVRVSVPQEGDQPKPGKANTCLDGDLYKRSIRLVNTVDDRTVTVLADSHYGKGIGCGQASGTGHLQLNVQDALMLLDAPLEKFEIALAFLVD